MINKQLTNCIFWNGTGCHECYITLYGDNFKKNLLTTYVVNYVYKHDHPFNGKPRKLRNIQRYTFKFQQLFAPPDVFSECLCNYNLNSKGKF